MGLFDFLKSKPKPKNAANGFPQHTDAIVKTSGVFRCPFCNCDLKKIIDKEALPVYEVFKRMGPIAGSVTMDTAREQFIYKQGITCSCGKELKPYKK